jgi:hypothetical protein
MLYKLWLWRLVVRPLFWEEGASIVLVDNNTGDLEQAMGGISTSGARLLGITADIAMESDTARIMHAAGYQVRVLNY